MSYCYLATATVLSVVALLTPSPYSFVLTAMQIFLFFAAFQRAQKTAAV